uniref:V-type proton ATPase subunit C n=1 Tax=Felis catus TaxID=9685 RepID=A0ABI7X485_FELCA
MSEFWLISAPGDKENLQALERMNTVTSKSNLSYNTKFSIPDFKVGTLDSLVGLSDELGKLDTFAESLIKRMAQSVVEVMEDSKGKVPENLLANGGLKEKLKCLKIDLTSFVTHFEWDMAKYPAKQPLVSVVDTLAKQLAQIETDLKSRTAAYNTLKTNLENLEKKSMGNLFTRTLSDIVSKEDFVLDSEYLVTLLVIVPKLIAEDNEGGLFTVTLFRKVIDDFKTKAKENKFTVREFYYDEKEIKREREELSRLLSDKKQQYQTSCVALKKGSSTFPDHKVQVTPLGNPDRPAAGQTDRERESEGEGEGPLLRWLKVNFSEAFIAWIHIKALRVFVESVLREARIPDEVTAENSAYSSETFAIWTLTPYRPARTWLTVASTAASFTFPLVCSFTSVAAAAHSGSRLWKNICTLKVRLNRQHEHFNRDAHLCPIQSHRAWKPPCAALRTM